MNSWSTSGQKLEFDPLIMKILRAFAAAAFLLSLASASAFAQKQTQTHDLEGARTAAIALLLRRSRGADSARIVPDSATMYQRFVMCRSDQSKPICALIGSRRVTVVDVQLTAGDSATVKVSHYVTLSATCGGRNLMETPRIVTTSGELFTLAYRDSVWLPSGNGTGWAC